VFFIVITEFARHLGTFYKIQLKTFKSTLRILNF